MTLLVAESARVSTLADIEDSVQGTLIEIGENVVIDAFVKIKPAGGSGDVRIGPRSVVNSGVVIYTGNGVTIGADVLVAANVVLAPTNHEFRDARVPIREQGFQPSRGGILIEDDVWIGAGTVMLDGAVVRRGAVIGANSVVRQEVAAYSVCVGSPLRVVGQRG